MKIQKVEQLIANKDFTSAKKLLCNLLLKNKINTDAIYLLSIIEIELGNPAEALKLLSRIIAIDPAHAAAHYTKANLLMNQDKHLDAMIHHDRAVELLPSNPWAFINRGISKAGLNNFSAATIDFDRAIELDPELGAAYGNKGVALAELGLYELSLEFLDKAIELDPHNVHALSGKAACLTKLKRPKDALMFAERAIVLKSDYAEAWNNLGNALNDQKRHGEALSSYERSIELRPNYAEAWNNLGNALNNLKRYDEALSSCNRAIDLKPDYAEAWRNQGNALSDLQRIEEALVSYENAMKLKPDLDFIFSDLLHNQMKICEWTDLEQRCQSLKEKVLAGNKAGDPFSLLGLFDCPKLQKRCAEIYVTSELNIATQICSIVKRTPNKKIRIGYFSMDFHEHPVSHLIADLIDLHDRSRFEVYGFSFGVRQNDFMRQRLEAAFDEFFDVNHLNSIDITNLSRKHEIDIAIDVGGYTRDARPEIFAYRAAPIQINYLGYPATIGNFMDYLIGDGIVTPSSDRENFFEKIISLPNSFQVNPSVRPVSKRKVSKEYFNLPQESFVYCCLNSNWKLTPEVFDSWVRILKSVKASVLWLNLGSETAKKNILRKFESKNIDSGRIYFASRVPDLSDHLSRYEVADLFLDTFPYGAHTTASDALWAGLPVVTKSGKSFASRVAASLLTAVGLSELITYTAEEYEILAIELAGNPEKLTRFKTHLTQVRPTAPLFNTALFARYIESAFEETYDRYHAGLPPDHIFIEA